MSVTAKLFVHGRSQAVRLPKECRFEGKEVRVTKIGNKVILEPLTASREVPWDLIDGLSDIPFPEGRDQPAMPPDKDVFES